MNIDLNTLSKADLEKLKADVEKALVTLDQRRKAEARKAAEQVAKEFGFSLDEVLGREKGSKKASVAKYANPADPRQTWSGRGRQPGWIKAGLAQGKSLDDFAI